MTIVTSHIFQGPLKYWKSGPKRELTQDIKQHSILWRTCKLDWKQKPNLITANTIYSENWNWAVILTRCIKMVQLNRKYTNAQLSIFKTNKKESFIVWSAIRTWKHFSEIQIFLCKYLNNFLFWKQLHTGDVKKG